MSERIIYKYSQHVMWLSARSDIKRNLSLRYLNDIHLKPTSSMDLQSLYNRGIDLVTNPKHTRWLAPLLQIADSCLCALIIWKVPCKPFREPIAEPIPKFPKASAEHTFSRRHRNRLASLYATSDPIPRRRTRLHAHQRRHRTSSLSRGACLRI